MAPGVPRGTPAGDDYGLLRGCKSFATSNATGALDHVLEVMGILGHHAVQAQARARPAPGALHRRECNDRHARPLTGRA